MHYRHLPLDRQTPLQHLELEEQRDLDLKHEGCTGVGAGAIGVSTGLLTGDVSTGLEAGGVSTGESTGGVSPGIEAGGGGSMEAIWLRIRYALVA